MGKDGFFIRDFFVFCREKSWKSCCDFRIGSGKVVFAKIECGSHDAPSVEGYSPAPGSRKLGNLSMRVKAAEDPAHLGAGFFLILTTRAQMLRRLKLLADVAIRETSQAVFSVHDCLE
jgi:hypothetical protein